MGPKINAPTMLSIIGIIQPASVENVQKYLQLLFPDLGSILDHQQIHKFCMNQANDGWLLRVARDPDLFSLTELGNSYLPRPLRLIRDKSRIYLLKFSRRARVKPSREGYASELGGVAPPVDASLILEGPEANKIDLVVPRGQSYWPRYSKQFVEDTGPLRSSRDDNFQFLSFASLEQLALGCRKEKKDLKLNFDTLGAMLGISPRLIVQIANRPNRHYRQFQIPKKMADIVILKAQGFF